MKIKLDSVVLLLVTLLTGTRATEYFVSLDGNDDNPGTLQKPWQHVQHAVTVLRAGDICTIREGHYSEEVVISGLQGTSDDPITFRSYPGETVVFDGTTPILCNQRLRSHTRRHWTIEHLFAFLHQQTTAKCHSE